MHRLDLQHPSRSALEPLGRLQEGEPIRVARVNGLDKDWVQTKLLPASLDRLGLGVPDTQYFIALDQSVTPSMPFPK